MPDTERVRVTITWLTGAIQTFILTPAAVDDLVQALFDPDQVVYECETFADLSPDAPRQRTSFRLKLIAAIQLDPHAAPPRHSG